MAATPCCNGSVHVPFFLSGEGEINRRILAKKCPIITDLLSFSANDGHRKKILFRQNLQTIAKRSWLVVHVRIFWPFHSGASGAIVCLARRRVTKGFFLALPRLTLTFKRSKCFVAPINCAFARCNRTLNLRIATPKLDRSQPHRTPKQATTQCG